MSWLDRLRTALDDGRFVLHAQPIIDLKSGEVVQEELLLRMLGVEPDGRVRLGLMYVNGLREEVEAHARQALDGHVEPVDALEVGMVDEAHRTQEGDLGRQMREALPNAFLFGLTGTPINRADRNTFYAFGAEEDKAGYMSRYGFEESIRDGATMPSSRLATLSSTAPWTAGSRRSMPEVVTHCGS